MADEQASATNDEPVEQKFIIQKIYCKDVSFETPNSPAALFRLPSSAMARKYCHHCQSKLFIFVYPFVFFGGSLFKYVS